MSGRTVSRCLIATLAVYLVLPLMAQAQTVEPHDLDTLDPGNQKPAATASSPDLARTSELIVTLTNRFRSQHQRHELKANPQLTRAAQDFADYLARTDTFSHTADGKRPSQRISEHGYQFCLTAENIAWEYNSAGFTAASLARALVTGWRHSPEHRKNLLDPDLDEIGVGVAYSKRTGRYYAVQDFARPRAKAIVFRITNETDATIRYTVDGKAFNIDPHYTITHQRCRPPELDFQEVRGKDTAGKEEDEIFHPQNGTHFTIRGDRGAGYTVDTK
jgi:uncharacterized protein YkwD